MSMELLCKSFDDAFYNDVRKRHVDSLGMPLASPRAFRKLAETEGIGPEDAELEKASQRWLKFYRVQEWETKKAKKVREFAADWWTVEKTFQGMGISLSDPELPVAKAFEMSSAQVIFPIFYDTIIMSGILAEPLLDVLVMETVPTNSHTADHAAMNETVTDRTMGETGEWAPAVQVNISATNNPIKLRLIAGQLDVSDEAARLQRIPILQTGIFRIGRQYAISITDFAIDVLLNGDGTTIGTAITQTASAVANGPVYGDFVKLYYAFPIGYEPTDIIASKTVLTRMQQIPQFQDPWAFNMSEVFQASGKLSTPFGLTPHRWDSTGSSTWNAGTTTNLDWLLMIQRERALIMYQEGGLMTETSRVPESRSTRTITSSWLGFGIFDRSAAQGGTSF